MSEPTRPDGPAGIPAPPSASTPSSPAGTATGPNGLPIVNWPVPAWRRSETQVPAPPEEPAAQVVDVPPPTRPEDSTIPRSRPRGRRRRGSDRHATPTVESGTGPIPLTGPTPESRIVTPASVLSPATPPSAPSAGVGTMPMREWTTETLPAVDVQAWSTEASGAVGATEVISSIEADRSMVDGPTEVPVRARRPQATHSDDATRTGRRSGTAGWVYYAAGALVILLFAVAGWFVYTAALNHATQGARELAHDQVDAKYFGPDRLVQHYLDSLAEGNAEGAWAIAHGIVTYRAAGQSWKIAVEPGPNDVLIDNAIYAEVTDRPTGIEVTGVDYPADGSGAVVKATYTIGDQQVEQTFKMIRAGTVDDGYSLWAFATPPVGSIQLTVSPAGKVEVAGRNVTSLLDGKSGKDDSKQGSVTLQAFPGTYPVRAAAPNKDGKVPDKLDAADPVTVLDATTPAEVTVEP